MADLLNYWLYLFSSFALLWFSNQMLSLPIPHNPPWFQWMQRGKKSLLYHSDKRKSAVSPPALHYFVLCPPFSSLVLQLQEILPFLIPQRKTKDDYTNKRLLNKSGSICLLRTSAMFYSVHVSGIHLLMMKNPTGVMQDVHRYYEYPFIDIHWGIQYGVNSKSVLNYWCKQTYYLHRKWHSVPQLKKGKDVNTRNNV